MLADLVDGADVGVVQGRGGAGFLEQPRRGVLILLGEYLDGDRALERRVVGLVDRAHPAFAQGSLDLVGADTGAGGDGHVRLTRPRYCLVGSISADKLRSSSRTSAQLVVVGTITSKCPDSDASRRVTAERPSALACSK